MLEAFLKLLDGGRPDRIVWTADITYWIAGQQQAGRADPAWGTEEGYLRLHRDLGIFPYYYYEKFWAAEPRYDGRVEFNRCKGRQQDRPSLPHTGGRTARGERLFALELFAGHHQTFC